MANQQLAQVHIKSARLDALLLLEYVTSKDRAWLLAHPDHKLNHNNRITLSSLVLRRVAREPMAYILGYAYFFGLKIAVTPDVLIPRPETESLVEAVLKVSPLSGFVLEVGTGSGAIAIALKKCVPSLDIVASDISDKALALARHNALSYGMGSIRFIRSNLLDNVRGKFDVVVANLPYIPNEQAVSPEVRYEPHSAIFAGKDGLLLYSELLMQLEHYKPFINYLVLEAEPAQVKTIKKLARLQGYSLQDSLSFCHVFKRAI